MTSKAQRISQTLRATRERRSQQRCLVYELKVDRSALSHETQQQLRRLFLEAKWFYNACLCSEHPAHFDDRARHVQIKVQDHLENRDLLRLSSQMKQGLLSRIGDALASLAAKKKKGKSVGKLKFKSFVNSIPLKQFGNTYRIMGSKHIGIQNVAGRIKVFGIHQLNGAELANANLIRRGQDYYLMVTCFREKETIAPKPFSSIGIDFNVSAGNQIVLSNEIAIGFSTPESHQIKREQRRLAHQDRANQAAGRSKYTRNRSHTRARLQGAHHKQNNLKKEIRNQVVHRLHEGFEQIVVQDESIKGWQRRYGRQVRNTALGRTLVKVKTFPTTRVVPRFAATSKVCSVCHGRNDDLTLDQEWWTCPDCSTLHNRHVNAAINMEQVGSERADLKPAEKSLSAEWLLDQFDRLDLKHLQVRILRRNRNSCCASTGNPLL